MNSDTRQGWTEERDGFTHTTSGSRVVPASPETYAVLVNGRQVRSLHGRPRRWKKLDAAMQFAESLGPIQ